MIIDSPIQISTVLEDNMLRTALIFITLLTAVNVHAASVDIGFNDDSFQLIYETPISSDDYGTSLINGRFLYNGDEDTRLGSIGFDFMGEPGNIAGLKVGAGVKGYAGRTDSAVDFANIGIGLRVDYILPQLQGLGFAARLNYAPKVFSFGDSDRLFEGEGRMTYAVMPKVKLYIGYQNIRLDGDNGWGHMTIDDSVRIGFVGTF